MSNPTIKRLPAALIAVAIMLSFWSARDAAGNRILVKIEATKQGMLKGDSAGKIEAMAVALESKSPTDAATGQHSGKVQNSALKITKAIDGASPQIFQALISNEVLKKVTIEFYSTSANGEELLDQTILLQDAGISELRQYTGGDDSRAPGGLEEDVSITYKKLDFMGKGGATPDPAPAPAAAAAPAAPAAEAPAPAAAAAAPTKAKQAPGELQPLEKPATRVPRARR
ncbi:MAG: type secretion system secreted protein Hcp [Phycisphaerales bacterium]|jgi:type VI secretion system secreted protein Hcp|nr:type secretion system secreted protein Hcp [Phycisphaerales bacterium]